MNNISSVHRAIWRKISIKLVLISIQSQNPTNHRRHGFRASPTNLAQILHIGLSNNVN